MKSHLNEKYYIYLRKSSEGEDRQIQSIERQADEVQKLIKYLDLTVVDTFQESRSAMIPFNRPEFTRMIKGVKSGKANCIVCWHINRLARNPLESGIIQQLLEDGKIKRIVTKDREYTSADNSIIFSVESSLATQYSKDLGKMIKSGMDKKVSQGIFPSKAPIGYLNTKLAEHGSNYIIKDPERFTIVRRIWDLMLTGNYVPSKILKMIIAETDLKSSAWKGKLGYNIARSNLYKVLTNPFYAGLFMYKGKLYTGRHEPMITIAEYDKVQEMLGRNGRPRPKKRSFAYTGIMTCSGCGSAITATEKTKLIKSTGLYKTYIYYHCTNRKKGANCTIRQPITVTELEKQIQDEITKVSISPFFLSLAKKIIRENTDAVLIQSDKLIVAQSKRIENIKQEIKNLLQLRIANTITDEEYKKEKEARENTILLLTKSIEESKENPVNVFKETEHKISGLLNLEENYLKSPDTEKRNIFSFIGENYHLNGKKLNIIKPQWLQSVEKNIKEVKAEMSGLELENYIDINSFSVYFKDMFPSMWRLVDEVGTAIVKEKEEKPLYHSITASNE